MLEIGGLPALDFSDSAITGSPWSFLGVSVAGEVILDRKKPFQQFLLRSRFCIFDRGGTDCSSISEVE